jgi:hypothetical protein
MPLQQIIAAQANAEVPVNENFQTLEHQSVYGRRHPVTTALTWGYYGGRWSGFVVTDGTLALTASQTNYVVVNRTDGVISVSTTTTNWNNTASFARVYQITTSTTTVTAVQDHRSGANGVHGFTDAGVVGVVQQVSQSTDYTLLLSDAGKHILHPSADTTARTFTIPANSAVAFPVGTVVTFVNQNAAGVITIAITTDTMRLAGAGTVGSRTLAANGIATAMKITSTEWIISGAGLT